MGQDGCEDACRNGWDGGGFPDGKDAFRLTRGDALIGSVDARVEVVVFSLKTIFVRPVLSHVPGVALPGTLEGRGQWRKQQDGQVWLESGAHRGVHREYGL